MAMLVFSGPDEKENWQLIMSVSTQQETSRFKVQCGELGDLFHIDWIVWNVGVSLLSLR